MIDLRGQLAIPVINDAHDHIGDAPFGTQATTSTPPMADPPHVELYDALAKAAAAAPSGGWIHAVVGRTTLQDVAGAQAAIARGAPSHPVVLSAWWGHGVLVNPRGLAVLRIKDTVAASAGGQYHRDHTGQLTGKMDEYAGWAVMNTLHTGAGKDASVVHLRNYSQRRIREGVTSVQVMAGNQSPTLFTRSLKAADLPLRVRVVPFPIPNAHGDGTKAWSKIPRQPGPRVLVSGVKWVLDGTPTEQLAWRTTAYQGRPNWYGRPNFSAAHVRRQLALALAGGEPLHLHVVGDAMAELVLTEMERLAPPERWVDRRVRLEHANGLTGPRVERARRMGIVIVQPRPTSPIRAWRAAGIKVAYGSDSGFPPFVAFAAMTAPSNPNSVSRTEALKLLTQTPAFAEFAEGDKGKLVPGMLADIAVLSQDVLSEPHETLAGTFSVLTVIGGQVVYDAAK